MIEDVFQPWKMYLKQYNISILETFLTDLSISLYCHTLFVSFALAVTKRIRSGLRDKELVTRLELNLCLLN